MIDVGPLGLPAMIQYISETQIKYDGLNEIYNNRCL